MFYDDSIERTFRLGGEDLLKAEDEGCVEQEDKVNENLEEKDSTERFESIIQLWDILGSTTL